MQACAESGPPEIIWTTKLTAHCATLEEGQAMMRGRTLFHSQINERALPFYLQRKGGTVEEYVEYSAQQVLPFTAEEEQRVDELMLWLQQQLEKHGLKLPDPGTINFVKTTGKEAQGASGYTSEGNIFLTADHFSREEIDDDFFHMVAIHELSHCLSRLFPEYRKALYSLIHFTVMDHDIEIPEEVACQILANPDVEHHNSYATFTIQGEKKDCYLVLITDSVFEKEEDTFLMIPGIVPLGGTAIYRPEDVDDFWDVFGQNTRYVVDPEEAMANNFAIALLHLDDGYSGYANPEILEGIVQYLKRE